jgi:hypothetical protein
MAPEGEQFALSTMRRVIRRGRQPELGNGITPKMLAAEVAARAPALRGEVSLVDGGSDSAVVVAELVEKLVQHAMPDSTQTRKRID